MGVIVALDEGTSSLRALVFSDEGRLLGSAGAEFTQFVPSAGWVEHDAQEIWRAQEAVLKKALINAKVSLKDAVALGITNQRETTIIWDKKTGIPIHRALVWQDTRTADICAKLAQEGYGETILQKTGLVLDPYFSATKIAWILDNVSGARLRAEKGELAFGTVDSWLIYKLTQGAQHVTDHSNASRTMLYNIHTCAWDPELLNIFRIPEQVLPKLVASSGVCGEYDGVPIAGVAGDQQAALFGQACLKPGMIKNTYGTGYFMLMNTGTRPVNSKNKLLATMGWKIGNDVTYALEGAVLNGGSVVKWLRDKIGIIQNASEIETLARGVGTSGGVTFVPALAGLGAPQWNRDARGMLHGMHLGTEKGHIAYAALEGLALQVVDLIDAMRIDSGLEIPELRVDGGGSANDLLMQMQADLLQLPIVRAEISESTAHGAALLAGKGVGLWKSNDDIAARWKADRMFEPSISKDEREARMVRWREAIKKL